MKVKELAYHRNGVSGLGFYCAIVKAEGRDMLVVRFAQDGYDDGKTLDQRAGGVVCAAFDIKLLAQGNIKFGENSWRGDHYAEVMDGAIALENNPS
jgi:hypothetical protein